AADRGRGSDREGDRSTLTERGRPARWTAGVPPARSPRGAARRRPTSGRDGRAPWFAIYRPAGAFPRGGETPPHQRPGRPRSVVCYPPGFGGFTFMRRTLLLVALCSLIGLPAFAQNTDIESLSGLQFNFGNPGARSLGMGGAFLGLADDASAAEANPAGLTILRKPEVSIEGRNYLEQQLLTTSGTFPDIKRTAFTHYSNRAEVTFASFVFPIKNFAIAAYYHEPLRNIGAGQVVPIRNEFTGKVETNVPDFYLPKGGGDPISAADCTALRNKTGDLFACQQFVVKPFLTAVDIQQRTYGIAGAWQIGKLSLGATARYQTFKEDAFTFRVTSTFDFDSILRQSTGKLKPNGEIEPKDETDLTFSGG